MKLTHPAENIGNRDNGCAVVSLLSTNAQKQILSLQEKLSHELPGLLWMMPKRSLHTTLCEIIQPKPYSEDKSQIWENNHKEYRSVLNDVLGRYGQIEISFNTIEASPHAVVIMGDDNGVFNDIRQELIRELPFPEETKKPPNVAHSSIARFVTEASLADVQNVVAGHSISFVETISEFQLMNNIWPHLLEYDIAERYRLQG